MNQCCTNSQLAFRLRTAALGAVSLVWLTPTIAFSQSATRSPTSGAAASQPATAGSALRPTNAATVGLDGYCPVCIIEMKQWVKGAPQIAAEYDGKIYYFPGQEQLDMFLKSPGKYVPALGGDCLVCYVNSGDRMPGSVQHAALSNKRLFLFPNKELQHEFLANPSKYTKHELALDGKCSVCRIEMSQDVAGNPEIFAIYNGFRYLFPGDEQKAMFLANPKKYEVK